MEFTPALIYIWRGPIYFVVVAVMLIARIAIIWRHRR
jgi:hypothetical protein